jgi:hypothetical protein
MISIYQTLIIYIKTDDIYSMYHFLSGIKHEATAECLISDKALLLVF